MLLQKLKQWVWFFCLCFYTSLVSTTNQTRSHNGLMCYQENCYRRDDQWKCKNSKPLEQKCDAFCHDFTHEGPKRDVYQIVRHCSEIHERNATMIRKIIEKKGEYCSESQNSRFCYCKQPLCNNNFDLPKHFES